MTFQVLDFWKHPLFNSRQKNLKITLSTPTTAKLWYQDQRTSYWVWFFRALPKLLLVICIKHFQSKSAIAKFWKRQVYLWLPIWKRANNKNNNRFLFGAEKQLDVDIPSKTKFTTIIIIISFKLHPPSIKSNILTKTSFYGQKMFQRNYLRRCWLTHKESCMGHRKKPISDISQILIFLEIFRKGSQPPSFWTEITSTHCY